MKSKSMTKIAAVATGLAMATSMLSLAPMAHAAALTSTQISSILGLLSSFGANSATIANVNAALTGTTVTSSGSTTTTTSACSFSSDLTIGATGMSVTCLQNALIAAGFSIPAGATGYFGTQTRAAVASWQSSRNIAPAVGYFGPISRAAFNLGGSATGTTTTTTTTTTTVAGCAAGAAFSATTGQACTVTTVVAGCAAGAVFSSTTGAACNGSTTVVSGPLTGAGQLTNESSLGNVTSDINVGDSATSVMGISADAIGGDVAIQRVDAVFTIGGTTGSSNLDRYISSVSLYLDGVKLASMDPALGDKDGRVWTYRFSGLNGVIRSGQTGQLYVKVTPVSSIGANEDGETVTGTLAVDSIRAVAADGISDTYGVAVSQAFTVSSATAGTLTVTVGNDNPAASLIAVSSSTTSGVTLLTFNVKAKNQAVTITDLPVQIGTSDNNLTDVISTVYLMKGSTVLSTKTVAAGTFGTTTFTGINQTIAKDATVSYSIKVDLKGDSAYADSTTLVASTTVYGWDISDADGATVTPSAAVVGNTLTLTATGITVVKGTPTAIVANGLAGKGDIATFTIPFTVTAGDTDVFIYAATPTKIASAATTPTANTGVNYATTTSSTAGATGEPTAILSAANVVTGDNVGGTAFKVLANTSRTFTFGATIIATTTGDTTAGYVGVILKGIPYGPTAAATSNYYTSGLDSFKTADVFVSLR